MITGVFIATYHFNVFLTQKQEYFINLPVGEYCWCGGGGGEVGVEKKNSNNNQRLFKMLKKIFLDDFLV